jgi:GT2 family glycosyltransferase
MGELPQSIYVVDNEAAEATEQLVGHLQADLAGQTVVTYAPQSHNSGGAGGFSAGVELALAGGAQWLWLMDDDVAVLPGALSRLRHWTRRVEADLRDGLSLDQTNGVIQGQRRNFDGSVFYWQYHFLTKMGIPNPVAPRPFGPRSRRGDGASETASKRSVGRPMNTACFEGGLFHRQVVEQIGLPDRRFFIYWDDTIYGYLAAKVTCPLIVSDFILQRTRQLDHHRLGKIRKLNSTSDMARYHIMRNRGYMARYLDIHGDYQWFWFRLGTLATFVKEVIRLSLAEQRAYGFSRLVAGWRDAWKVRCDSHWQPMPPLVDQ